MASISVRFVTASGTITGSATLTDANVVRILAAEKTYLGTVSNQETVNAIARQLVDELKGNTRTVERSAAVIPSLD